MILYTFVRTLFLTLLLNHTSLLHYLVEPFNAATTVVIIFRRQQIYCVPSWRLTKGLPTVVRRLSSTKTKPLLHAAGFVLKQNSHKQRRLTRYPLFFLQVCRLTYLLTYFLAHACALVLSRRRLASLDFDIHCFVFFSV